MNYKNDRPSIGTGYDEVIIKDTETVKKEVARGYKAFLERNKMQYGFKNVHQMTARTRVPKSGRN